jgi:hypothetical protein
MSVKKPATTPPSKGAPALHQAQDVEQQARQDARLDRVAGWVLVALALALYLRTGARDLLPGDPGEFQTAAWRFGVAHATGYPLYLLGGGIWQRILGVGGISPAYALNLLSGFTAAAAVGLLYMAALRVAPGTAGIRRAGAVVGAAWLATMPTFWSQALVAEVYALHALFVALLLWIVAGWETEPDRPLRPTQILAPALVVGLSLAHHATTLLLLPGLVWALWRQRMRLPRDGRTWLWALLLAAAPLLLYLYIPLRATPTASPWFFPTLGAEQLALYGGGVRGFFDFVSGRSISVGFYPAAQALEQVAVARQLWTIHLALPGLVLAAIGLYTLANTGRSTLLAFSALSAALLQLYNLFYAIGDILVYYIPLYVIAALWIGAGAAQLAQGLLAMVNLSRVGDGDATPAGLERGAAARQGAEALGVFLVLALLFFPMRQWVNYQPRLDQTDANGARLLWESVLAANPAPGAILVSNDRNEIVPLYYLQAVEGRRPDLAGIFPLLTPESRFADIGATLETALAARAEAGTGDVLLIKPMPGLEVKFALEPAGEPLVRVLGPAAGDPPAVLLNQPYGPLTLAGFDWEAAPGGEAVTLRLVWQVEQPVPGDFTTTTQIFDASGNRLAQNDAAPGGVFYPTGLWKVGETIVETHTLQLPSGAEPATLLVGMYTGPELSPLAAPLNVALDGLLPG